MENQKKYINIFLLSPKVPEDGGINLISFTVTSTFFNEYTQEQFDKAWKHMCMLITSGDLKPPTIRTTDEAL